MTPEEQAAADAAAAAAAAPVIDYTKFDYTKLAAEVAKAQAIADKPRKDAEAKAAADAATEAKRVKDEADAAAAAAEAKRTGTPKWVDPKDTPEFKKLAADLKDVNDRDAARQAKAELKERSGIIHSALGDYTLASPSAKASAVTLFMAAVKLGDDGESYVGPDGSPAEQYIARMLDTEYDYFLAKKDVGGSGARNGGSRKDSAIDIDQIKPGMTPAAKAQAYAEISRLQPR